MALNRKPLISSFILFLTALIILNTQRMHYELQNVLPDPKRPENPYWFEVVARELGDEGVNVGLINADAATTIHTEGKVVEIDFNRVDRATTKWAHFYPTWIDEGSATCPWLPMPVFRNYKDLDVVVARVVSSQCAERDVSRLHLNLVVANLLVRSGRMGRPIFAVFEGSCGPMWEIFKCDDLVLKAADSWIYRPQLWRIKQIVHMPVGSCQLSLPSQNFDELLLQMQRRKQAREAYATVIHTSETYVCGAIALAQSILQSNSTKDLVLLVDDHISPNSIDGLRSAGWKIKPIQRIRSPFSEKNSYNEWNYSKLRLWQLLDYDKVIFIDADFIVTRNLDAFFALPEISARGNHMYLFNSGLMLLEPSSCTFRALMERRPSVRSYNGGDQGFLNEMFTWWHRLPNKVNALTYFDETRDGDHTVGADAYAVHYLGLKPWMCYRDYDCNWDRPLNHMYASDSANAMWWDVYDKMQPNLKPYCALTPQREALITKHRNNATDMRLLDAHWRIQIKDTRQNTYTT